MALRAGAPVLAVSAACRGAGAYVWPSPRGCGARGRRLGTLLEPAVHPLGLKDNLVGRLTGPVTAHDLDEAAVARRAAVRRDQR